MARLTWQQVSQPSFSDANSSMRLASELISRAAGGLDGAIENFQDARSRRESGDLMASILQNQDPAAMQEALASGSLFAGRDPRYINPSAFDFAAQQRGRLLGEQQTEANIRGTNASTALTGVNTERARFGLGRDQVTAGREDERYAANQEAQPIWYEATRRARAGDMSGAQGLLADNAALLGRAGFNPESLYSGLSSGFTGGMGDVQAAVGHDNFMRTANTARDARELVDRAGQTFATEAEAMAAIREAQASGAINAELATEAQNLLGQSNLWTPETEAQAAARAAGIPMYAPARGGGNSQWAESIGLVNSESGGNWNALNDEGFGGRLQFGDARLEDAARAGLVPAGTTGADFSRMTPQQQRAVEEWHFGDIDRQASRLGLDRYYGQNIGGVTISRDTIRSMAHLGGVGGVQQFIESGGRYNPADSNGTRLTDYGTRFGAGSGTPLSFGSSVPAMGDPMAGPAVNRMLTAASGDAAAPTELTPEQQAGVDFRMQTEAAARSAEEAPTLDALVSSPELARQNPDLVSQLLGQALQENAGSNAGTEFFNNALERNVNDALAAAEAATPEGIIAAGTQGDDPLFTVTDGGQVTARPPRGREEVALVSRAAQAGILATSPERAAQQAEIDRTSRLMAEAGGRDPVSVREAETAGSQFSQDYSRTMQAGDVAAGIERVASGLATGAYGAAGSPFARTMGGILDYFGEDSETAQRNAADREATSNATQWWRSAAARQYFTDNPQALAAASENPVLFAQERIAETASAAMTAAAGNVSPADAPADAAGRPRTVPAIPPGERLTATDTRSAIRSVDHQLTLDGTNNQYAPLDQYLLDREASGQYASDIASTLTADDGPFSNVPAEQMTSIINQISNELGLEPSVAAALVRYVGTEDASWFPNWLTSPTWRIQGMDQVRQVWEQYQQSAVDPESGNNRDPLRPGVDRLTSLDRVRDARTSIDQWEALYDQMVGQMRADLAKPGAKKEEITAHYETQVFPQIYNQIAGVYNSGIVSHYTATNTGQ